MQDKSTVKLTIRVDPKGHFSYTSSNGKSSTSVTLKQGATIVFSFATGQSASIAFKNFSPFTTPLPLNNDPLSLQYQARADAWLGPHPYTAFVYDGTNVFFDDPEVVIIRSKL